MRPRPEIIVEPHCSIIVADAIRKFCERWRTKSRRSSIYSLYRLLNKLVDPVWRTYLKELPRGYFECERSKCLKIALSDCSPSDKFTALHKPICSIHRSLKSRYNKLLESRRTEEDRSLISSTFCEFSATLNTLRNLAFACRTDQAWKERMEFQESYERGVEPRCKWRSGVERCPKPTELETYLRGGNIPAKSNGLRLSPDFCTAHRHGLQVASKRLPTLGRGVFECGEINPSLGRSHYAQFCRFCGSLTETRAYVQETSPTAVMRKGATRLSSVYCEQHRPKSHDGSWNPDYLRALRHESSFKAELARLERQAANFREFASGADNPRVSVFIRNLVSSLNVFEDEESDIRRAARSLIDNRLTDRKKEIVTLFISGRKQADIARALRISRQAVSKILKEIPKEYRFEVY